MTPTDFQRKWKGSRLSERSAYQQHFLDLCDLVGHPKPAEVDTTGKEFCFEKHVQKQFEGDKGFADVWMRDHFALEYKGPHKDLEAALRQLMLYRRDLDNPPLLVVCDTDTIRVHTDFNSTANTTFEITIDTIGDPESLRVLRALFFDPDSLRPGRTRFQVTELVAERVGSVAQSMRARGVDPQQAAHFLMKIVFSLFAEDIGLLRRALVTSMLQKTVDKPDALDNTLKQLFSAMADGGLLLYETIDHFNGGLFDDDVTVVLTSDEIRILAQVAADDWAQVEPAVFGTLFERGLDPAKRSQLGAHYTSREDILLVVEPVVMQPLRREWEAVRQECDDLARKAEDAARRQTAGRRDACTSRRAGKPSGRNVTNHCTPCERMCGGPHASAPARSNAPRSAPSHGERRRRTVTGTARRGPVPSPHALGRGSAASALRSGHGPPTQGAYAWATSAGPGPGRRWAAGGRGATGTGRRELPRHARLRSGGGDR